MHGKWLAFLYFERLMGSSQSCRQKGGEEKQPFARRRIGQDFLICLCKRINAFREAPALPMRPGFFSCPEKKKNWMPFGSSPAATRSGQALRVAQNHYPRIEMSG
jgi:hypothetical protein